MMTYATLDPVLQAWARRHGLFISTRYKDDEVRATMIVDDAGAEYDVWLTPPDAKGRLAIHILSRPDKQSSRIETSMEDLGPALECAYDVVSGWIEAAGHSRSVYGPMAKTPKDQP